MNNLQIFDYEGNEVRTIYKKGKVLWVLKDVCKVLDVLNSRQAAERLDFDEKEVSIIETVGGLQEMITVNESGLYSIILTSRKTEAKKFKRWITHDVLPSIRHQGFYATDELISNPDLLIKILEDLKTKNNKIVSLKNDNENLLVKLNQSKKFWTIMKFNQHFNMHWDMKTCQRNGKAASAYSHQHGYEIRKCKTNDDRFIETNSYAYEVLEKLFLLNY